ncbi:MAG: hypothetical protein JJE22_12335 [Bacteroidia bacterium]|nr:hypothetical protein [Bacteroidia bacterium]
MGKKQETKKVHIKRLRKEVQEKLAVALADYKSALPQEKYSKTLKKASKLFVSRFEKINQREKEKISKRGLKKVAEKVEDQLQVK